MCSRRGTWGPTRGLEIGALQGLVKDPGPEPQAWSLRADTAPAHCHRGSPAAAAAMNHGSTPVHLATARMLYKQALQGQKPAGLLIQAFKGKGL